MTDYLYWQRRLRDHPALRPYTGPLPPDNELDFRFIKGDSALLAIADSALKGDALLSLLQQRFLKGDSDLSAIAESHIRGDTLFATFDRLIKGDTAFLVVKDSYIRGDTDFAFNARFIKGNVLLLAKPTLSELGSSPLATQPGLLSRHWLSVASVKKQEA